MDSNNRKIFAKDYLAPTIKVISVDIDFAIKSESEVTVISKLEIKAESASTHTMNIGENVILNTFLIDGQEAPYKRSNELLTFDTDKTTFTIETDSTINPKENTAYAGLYLSESILCTQNEPEGFRNITPFFDRPDILSIYTVTIQADAKAYPILLSNGNKLSESINDHIKSVTFHDPFPKPSYLFAIVAGDLDVLTDTHKTLSGRDILLEIYMDHGFKDRCYFAMEALKKSMSWDESRFGLECDLDEYRIVIVQAFNFGAMENKGLNIFNAKLAYADPATSTDTDYQNVLSVIGHEYFHNWTGNRVICRDWFQLTLKEGLTVFREQEFMADMGLHDLGRIQDVESLLRIQFSEDSGPNAHAIRPAYYESIDNFYTPTVYEKGAEVIRMLQTIVGKEGFQNGLNTYFKRHDGLAVTCDDFVNAIISGSGSNLDQQKFMHWYEQCGTPHLDVHNEYDASSEVLTITVKQTHKATKGYANNKPYIIPVSVGLLSETGTSIKFEYEGKIYNQTAVLLLEHDEQTFTLNKISSGPIVSLLRNFSAPVTYTIAQTREDLVTIMRHDTDGCTRYMAGSRLMIEEIRKLMKQIEVHQKPVISQDVIDTFGHICAQALQESLLSSRMMDLPGIELIALDLPIKDYSLAQKALDYIRKLLATEHKDLLLRIIEKYQPEPIYTYNQEFVSARLLRNTAMKYLLTIMGNSGFEHAKNQYYHSDNMTDQLAVFSQMSQYDTPIFDNIAEDFFTKWKDDLLIITKYFNVIGGLRKESVFDQVEAIWDSSYFRKDLPNHVNSLLTSGVCKNYEYFHHASGRGYQIVEKAIMEIDSHNGSLSAWLAKRFLDYGKLPEVQNAKMKETLDRLSKQNLSKDAKEIITSTLGA